MALRFVRSLGDAAAPALRPARGGAAASAFALAALGVFACRGPEFNTSSGGGAQAGGNAAQGGGGSAAQGGGGAASQGGGGAGGSGPGVVTVTYKNNLGAKPGFTVGVNDDTGASIATATTNAAGKAEVTVPVGGWVMVLDDSDPDGKRVYAAKVTSGVSAVVFYGVDVNPNPSGELALSGSCNSCTLGQDDIEFHLSCSPSVRRVTTIGSFVQTNSFLATPSCPNSNTVEGTLIAYAVDGSPKATASVSGAAGVMGLNGNVLSAVSPSDWNSLALPISGAGGLPMSRVVEALDADGFPIRSWRDPTSAAAHDLKLIKSLATNLRVTRQVKPTPLSFISRSQRIANSLSDPGSFDVGSLAIPQDVPPPSFATIGQPEFSISLGGGPTGDAVTVDLIDDALTRWSVSVPPTDIAPLRFPKVPDGFDAFVITQANSTLAFHIDVADAPDYAAYLAGGTFSSSAQPLLVQDVTLGGVSTQF